MKAVLLPDSSPALRPLTYATPPALVPFLGRSLLALLLRSLQSANFEWAAIALEGRCSELQAAVEHGIGGELPLALLPYAGTPTAASALGALAERGAFDETVVVLPATGWIDTDWPTVVAAHRNSGGGVSQLVAHGGPTPILLADPGANADRPRPLPVFLRWRPMETWSDYWRLAAESLTAEHPRLTPPCTDFRDGVGLGPLARLSPRAVVRGAVRLGPGAVVDPGAELHGPAWVGADCRIGPGVRLEECAVEGRARLHGPLELRRCLVYGNRAISFEDGSARVLQGLELASDPARAESPGIGLDLLRLAERTARSSESVLDPARTR